MAQPTPPPPGAVGLDSSIQRGRCDRPSKLVRTNRLRLGMRLAAQVPERRCRFENRQGTSSCCAFRERNNGSRYASSSSAGSPDPFGWKVSSVGTLGPLALPSLSYDTVMIQTGAAPTSARAVRSASERLCTVRGEDLPVGVRGLAELARLDCGRPQPHRQSQTALVGRLRVGGDLTVASVGPFR